MKIKTANLGSAKREYEKRMAKNAIAEQKDYDRIIKQLQKIIKECSKIVPMVQKSKFQKEILSRLENDTVTKELLVTLALEKAKVDVLKHNLNKDINRGL